MFVHTSTAMMEAGDGERARYKTLHSFMTDRMPMYITVAIFCVYEMFIVCPRLFK